MKTRLKTGNLLHNYVHIWFILESIIELDHIFMAGKFFQYLDLSFNILNSYGENHLPPNSKIDSGTGETSRV